MGKETRHKLRSLELQMLMLTYHYTLSDVIIFSWSSYLELNQEQRGTKPSLFRLTIRAKDRFEFFVVPGSKPSPVNGGRNQNRTDTGCFTRHLTICCWIKPKMVARPRIERGLYGFRDRCFAN